MEYILRWVDGSARDKWLALNKSTSENKKLYESIKRKFGMLKYNPYRGDRIKKDRIPKSYMKKYNLDNLLKININQYWRLLYYVKALDKDTTLVIVIDFLPHTEYDRLFGYR
jgi:plasmid maintenance system killer protein